MSLIKHKKQGLAPLFWNNFFDENRLTDPQMGHKGSQPMVNIQENDDHYSLELASPGMKKEDFNIDLDDRLLRITAESKTENSEKDDAGEYTRREFSYQSFERSFTLPENVNYEKVEANYRDGVLKVSIPKLESVENESLRKIEVK